MTQRGLCLAIGHPAQVTRVPARAQDDLCPAERLALVLSSPQLTVDTVVVHCDHRRRGVGVVLLAAAVEHARETGAGHVVAAVGGQEPERQRFLARMGFAPLTTRRIAGVEQLTRQLASWQRNWVTVPVQRGPRRPRRR